MNTAKMSAFALRAIMGEAFDDDAYERGRQDARKFFREHPEERESKIEEVKQRLESGVYRHSPGPSYWIGCLCFTSSILDSRSSGCSLKNFLASWRPRS